jgi:hypothetical protein
VYGSISEGIVFLVSLTRTLTGKPTPKGLKRKVEGGTRKGEVGEKIHLLLAMFTSYDEI